ncbi:MAG: cation:proton antiporter [Gammaproteobacteria bacterium]|nr:cation:proton antiporter [Gammaproteobacteria bacterium]
MHVVEFIQDLAIIMLLAGFTTVIFHQFKQPVVLGYILAGIIIGPYTPPFSFISDPVTINTLAELGIVFLMFSLGLEFSFRKLFKVGLAAIITSIAEITLMIWLGYRIGIYFQWTKIDSIFLGGILAISSTTIIIKALKELHLEKQPFVQLIFGILIVEDLLAIAMLTILSSIAISGTVNAHDVVFTMGKLSLFIIVISLLGMLIVPRLLTYVAKFDSNEMLLVTVLGLCFGYCLLAIKLEYSLALGAFIIGSLMAESKELKLIEQLIEPLRDMFSAIFFVSVGLLLDPKILLQHAWPVAIITLAVVVGKVIACSFGSLLAGKDGRTSFRVGMGLAQIGEFSFIIATMGVSLKVTSDFLYPIAVAVSVITTFLTPYLIRLADPFAMSVGKIIPLRIVNFFKLYTVWLHKIGNKEWRSAPRDKK